MLKLAKLSYTIALCLMGMPVVAQQERFTSICLGPQNVAYCDLFYIMDYCEWDPSQERTAETRDCFVEAGDALNDDIVNCAKENVDVRHQKGVHYQGASGLAAWSIEYSVSTRNGVLFFRTGALWGGQEFDSTFIELFPFSAGTLFVDNNEVVPPSGRVPLSEALSHEFWVLCKEGELLTTSDGDKFEIAELRAFYSAHLVAMSECLIEASDIFG